MNDDEEFTPRLGRIRANNRTRERSYLNRVLQGIARQGGQRTPREGQRFNGSRIGRGSGIGRVLRSRGQYAASRSRPVIVQVGVRQARRT